MAPFAETPIMSFTDSSTPKVTKEPDLLDGWWTSEYNFSLEHRAILGKTWLCIAHRSRFLKPGDYISMELAGFPIIVILGKDRVPRTFHNVCRHRAYTVTKKPAGSSLILGCRYHGWSYDTRGKLVKAPHFEGIPGFDKADNGLFNIRTCSDRGGFIYVNLDSSNRNHVPDCEHSVNFAADQRLSAASKWLTSWEVNGAFNWKTIGASDRTGIGTTNINGSRYSFLDYVRSIFRQPHVDTSEVVSLHVPPLTSVFIFPSSELWVMGTALPVSAGESRLRCDIFTTSQEKILNEDHEKALRTFFDGFMHDLEQRYSKLEVPLLSDVSPTYQEMKEHLKLERQVGRKIFPGRKDEGRSESFCRAEKVCRELDDFAKSKQTTSHHTARSDSVQGDLDW